MVVAYLIRSRVPFVGVYLALGALCWWSLHEAHIHTTLAGVAFGLLAPVTPRRDTNLVDAAELGDLLELDDIQAASRLSRHAQESVSVVEWLEFRLHPWSAFVVVPVFALANAGIRVPTGEFGHIMSQPVTWGVILGLVVGKPIGITIATLLAVRLRVGRLPDSVTKRYVVGAGALAGIGFTVSLFVTDLAFGESIHADEAKLGVLVASLTAALIGSAICLPGIVHEPASSRSTNSSGEREPTDAAVGGRGRRDAHRSAGEHKLTLPKHFGDICSIMSVRCSRLRADRCHFPSNSSSGRSRQDSVGHWPTQGCRGYCSFIRMPIHRRRSESTRDGCG